MTNNEFINELISIVNLPTYYKNKFPENCGYYNGSKYGFDCVCLLKCAMSGWKPSTKKGSYMSPKKFVCGDITESTMISKCKTQGTDFSKIPYVGCMLYMSGHVGAYVGEHMINGKVYNAIECTTSYSANKVTWAWFDTNGTRRAYKGGGATTKKWTKWGVLPWVTYEEKPQPAPTPSTQPLTCGETVKDIQKYLNTYYGNDIKKTVGALLVVDGSCGTKTKKGLATAFQVELNKLGAAIDVDGDFGTKSQNAFTSYVGVLKSGSKGIFVTLWQELLVCYGQKPNGIDGKFGPGCISATNKLFKSKAMAQDSSVSGADINKFI